MNHPNSIHSNLKKDKKSGSSISSSFLAIFAYDCLLISLDHDDSLLSKSVYDPETGDNLLEGIKVFLSFKYLTLDDCNHYDGKLFQHLCQGYYTKVRFNWITFFCKLTGRIRSAEMSWCWSTQFCMKTQFLQLSILTKTNPHQKHIQKESVGFDMLTPNRWTGCL